MRVLLQAMSASLADLEARVAALEADRADYRAVLATINALSHQTRERYDQLDQKIDRIAVRHDSKFDALNGRMRSMEESMGEVRDLLVRALDKK